MTEYGLEDLRIVSESTVATLDQPDEDVLFAYQMGTWLFLLSLLFVFAWSTYWKWLMPISKKEAYLLSEIDKLDE